MRSVLTLTALVIAFAGCTEIRHAPDVQMIAQVSPTPPVIAEPASTPDENEKFRKVPEQFAKVDFRNFRYPFGRLTDGELDTRDPNDPLAE
jgi:hypothetical protein